MCIMQILNRSVSVPGSDDCTVCLEEIKWKGRYRGFRAECCNYWYHDCCLKEWYKLHNLCPTCRTVKQRLFQLGHNVVELTDNTFTWTDPNRYVIIEFNDIETMTFSKRESRLVIEIKLNESWTSYRFFISSDDDNIEISKIYDSIVHLQTTRARHP